MIDTPEVTNVPPVLYAKLHVEASPSMMQQVMGPAIGEAMAAAREQGVGPIGPWFAHHHEITPELFKFDVCVPVSAPVTAAGRVTPGQRPSVRLIRTIYRGPYEGLAHAWQSFDRLCAAQGLTTATDLYERYLVGPESTPNPKEWQTELARVVVGAT